VSSEQVRNMVVVVDQPSYLFRPIGVIRNFEFAMCSVLVFHSPLQRDWHLTRSWPSWILIGTHGRC
jgi:hypothetical protein